MIFKRRPDGSASRAALLRNAVTNSVTNGACNAAGNGTGAA